MLPESVITTCVLLGALKPMERWQAMRNFHQSSNIMLDRRIILIEVAVIVILILALCWVNYRQRRREKKVTTKAFNSFARRSGLSAEEQNLALVLAYVADLKEPDLILVSTAAFDKGAAALLSQESGSNVQKEIAAKLTHLRRKLGFTTRPWALQGSAINGKRVSTRQIPIGKILQITRRKTSAAVHVESRLIRSDDLKFAVELPEVLKIVSGEVWNLQYNFGPSVWEFDARLIRADGRELTFGHSDDVRFINRRRFLRVEVNKEAYIARFMFEASKKMQLPEFVAGNLREIAGPGLLIEAPLELKVGERVILVMQAAEDMVVQDIGQVRHIKPAEKGYDIAVELTGLTETNIDEMVRLTNLEAVNSQITEPIRV